jgi:hypothetical protein
VYLFPDVEEVIDITFNVSTLEANLGKDNLTLLITPIQYGMDHISS